ncbi:anaerobic ribonucleoside triphosphate reductase [Muribaculum intestinale]|jgi:ribonucleoside-triphosphate reductase|uniref:anaerobic ribonucleoside triphosphate reductase n=1 Tax=Bacteroidales TaxID=171549 RepID=UPI000D144C1E|nr:MULTISPECIES: anaerobic ribonucleoside triphosphate reductase [Bacteroidales]PWB10517.1 anaerobic ribonucleoside triphosphate reductase [Muribaculum intestinale]
MKVIKRDGRTVDFNPERIRRAVNAARCAVKQDDLFLVDTVTSEVAAQCVDGISVEEIQDLVEQELVNYGAEEVAKAYHSYREERTKARNAKSDQTISDIVACAKNEVTRENANMNSDTPAGMMMKISSETSKRYVDDYLLSSEARKFVEDNLLHVHDKDYYPTRSLTCVQSPIDRILNGGFRAGHGESRPAKRIETASILSCISIEQTQNEQHGGQSIPAFDFYMAPYVRKTYIEELKKIEDMLHVNLKHLYEVEIADYINMPSVASNTLSDANFQQFAINQTVHRVHQAMEALVHNLNEIHSRGGNQVVFSSLNYGTDTSAEGRCVIRELLNTTYRGVGNGSTAIFPIQILKIKDGVNKKPGDPNYDLYQLACKVTAKRFFPNFLNLDASFNKDESWDPEDPRRFEHEVATMGCRTRVYENRHGEKTSIGRGNLSFSTMNLPGLALSVMHIQDQAERINTFFGKLSKLTDVTIKQLLKRYEFQCEALAKQFPLLMSGMWIESEKLQPTDNVAPVLKHGTLGVGFIGLAECLIALIGKHHGECAEAQRLGLSIIGSIKNQVDICSKKYDLNFSVLATPAEGLSGKFTKKDRKKYGVVPGVTDKDYYTNSNHVPVYYHCSAKHKAAVEGPYHELTRGGHIFYVELDGDATHNVQAIDDIVKLMDKYNIGYASVNHNRNRCLVCGYEDASNNLQICPQCGSTHIDRLQRITGYLVGTTDRWNDGKLAELKDRVTHD